MLSCATFNRELRASYVPHYAYVRFEPKELWSKFSTRTIIKSRNVGNKRVELVKVSKVIQRSTFSKIMGMKKIEPLTIGISSDVNDYLAHETASCLNLQLLRNIPTLRWLWVTSNYKYKDIQPNLVIIRSIMPERSRLYEIRDLLDQFSGALKLVVIGGIDALTYFDDYLHCPLDGMLHIEGTTEELPRYATVESSEDTNCSVPVFSLNSPILKDLANLKKKTSIII